MTIFLEPMIVVRRSLLGASQDSSTFAIVPDGNSSVTKATSGMSGRMQPRLMAMTCVGVSSEPVAEDREVVRAEVPDDADVRLVEAEVHAARRDRVDVAELTRLDQLADLVDRWAVEERVARHQHEPELRGELGELDRFLRRAGERLLDEDVLARLERALRERVVRSNGRRDRDRIDVRILE